MQKPLEISFSNVDPSPAIEAEIRERVAKLEKIYDRLVHCRVVVTLQRHQQRTGNVFDVHIELVVPGEELVVRHDANHAKQHHASPDLRTSVKDAFKAAERQLKDFKERQRGDVKLHGSQPAEERPEPDVTEL
jgi:ribosomal subunit interface protein